MAKALGTHIANHLIDLHASTEEFRSRYLEGIRKAAIPWLFPDQQKQIVPASLANSPKRSAPRSLDSINPKKPRSNPACPKNAHNRTNDL